MAHTPESVSISDLVRHLGRDPLDLFGRDFFVRAESRCSLLRRGFSKVLRSARLKPCPPGLVRFGIGPTPIWGMLWLPKAYGSRSASVTLSRTAETARI